MFERDGADGEALEDETSLGDVNARRFSKRSYAFVDSKSYCFEFNAAERSQNISDKTSGAVLPFICFRVFYSLVFCFRYVVFIFAVMVCY